jgi:hypothetical protein
MLLLAAALPLLFWDGGPSTAPALHQAGIERVAVPAFEAGSWNGMAVQPVDLKSLAKLTTPAVEYRPNEATASRAPWIDSNGSVLLRRPDGHYYYDAPGPAAALAAAEAYSYGAAVLVRTDRAGLKPFADMLRFLRAIPQQPMTAVADIAFEDDGGDTAAEVLNLMLRNNLLVRVGGAARLTVRLGTPEFPMAEAQDPSAMAHTIRARLTDEKRSLRIYGTQVVLARLLAANGRARVLVLNYDGAHRAVDGLRVRVLGRYPNHTETVAGKPDVRLLDYAVDAEATEFTLPSLATFAVVDLSK